MIKRHKHADMIIAKANNMDLIVLGGFGSGEWVESPIDYNEGFCFLAEFDYFLCLPQHKDVCLNWLNGGDIQINRLDEGFIDWDRPSREWKLCVSFMSDKCKFRIKPRKEKRWIAVRKKDLYVEEFAFKSIDSVKESIDTELWSYHEIEVEV